MREVVERARYAIEHGNSDQLHRDLVAEVERLRGIRECTALCDDVERDRDALLAEVERLRQQRVIETVEQLDALPSGAIVLGARGSAWEHEVHEGLHYWYQTGEHVANAGEPNIPLPASLLWLPEWGNA